MENERLARIEEKVDALLIQGADKETRIRALEKNQTKLLAWAAGFAAVIPMGLKTILEKFLH